MADLFKRLQGYQRWGQVLGVIAKLRWFEKNNYLGGFCQNYGYNYEEMKIFLKISNSIIEGDSMLYNDLKNAYSEIESNSSFTQDEISILNSLMY